MDLLILDGTKIKECPKGWTPFFDQMWYGLREGCNCNLDKTKPENWRTDKIYGRECRGVQE